MEVGSVYAELLVASKGTDAEEWCVDLVKQLAEIELKRGSIELRELEEANA